MPSDEERSTMKTVGVDPQLQRNYDEYYGGDISEWREMGAIDKVSNIRSLCASLAPSSVLDIGAGEGSVLQRLADGGFGRRHFIRR
jgi:2-polyprenyl-3-methyl-5-hydroxy-6-metoxy-1,4-benzoquinol methylase